MDDRAAFFILRLLFFITGGSYLSNANLLLAFPSLFEALKPLLLSGAQFVFPIDALTHFPTKIARDNRSHNPSTEQHSLAVGEGNIVDDEYQPACVNVTKCDND